MLKTLGRDIATALSAEKGIDKVAVGLLFLGPLALFIERAPADIWMSLVGIVLLVHTVVRRDVSWLNPWWVRLALLLWVYWLVRAGLSDTPARLLRDAGPWVRFPLFGAAAMLWLGRSPAALRSFVGLMAIALAAMCVVLIGESILTYPAVRLTGPYSNPYPPIFIVHAALAVIVLLVWQAKRAEGGRFFLLAGLGAAVIAITLLAGGRADFIMLGLVLMIQVFFTDRWPWRRIGAAALLIVLGLGVVMAAHDGIRSRFTGNVVIADEEDGEASDAYMSLWRTGLRMGLENPVFGVGPGGYKYESDDPRYTLAEYGRMDVHANKHPHHTYLQYFAEGGAVGVALFVALAVSFWRGAIGAWRTAPGTWIGVFPVTAVFVYTWPLIPGMSIFSQISGVMNWTMLGVAFACMVQAGAIKVPQSGRG